MTSTRTILVSFIILVSHALAAENTSSVNWVKLVRSGKLTEATKICEHYTQSGDQKVASEGDQCLANVELQKALQTGSRSVSIRSDGQRGVIGPGVDRSAIEKALKHLRQAASWTPQNLAIHQGRIHILLEYGSPQLAPQELKQILGVLNPLPSVDTWLVYGQAMQSGGFYKTATEFFQVVEQYYPNDYRTVSNIGAFATLAKQDKLALEYLKKSIKLNPKNFNAHWNLGRLYEFMNKLSEADASYDTAIQLASSPKTHRKEFCHYAEFLENKVKNLERAKKVRASGCKRE